MVKSRSEGTASMRMWGLLLRRLRTAASLSHEQLAAHVGYSASLVISVERGIRALSPVFIRKADERLAADGLLIDAARHLDRQRIAHTAVDYAEEEIRARAVWAYDTHVLHPLLRTEAYTRALLLAHRPVLSDDEIEARVKLELERQARMTSEPACTYSFIIEEWILRRTTGGPTAMRDQLDRLLAIADLRNVTLQILPTSHDAHPGLTGPMTLLQGPEYTWQGHVEFHDAHHFIDNLSQVTTLHDRFTHLRSLALTPADSVELLRRMREEPPR